MKNLILIILFCIAAEFSSQAQTFMMRGKVVDAGDSTAVYGATVTAYLASDSTNRKFAETDTAGRFRITGLDKGNYVLKISYLGYKPLYVKAAIVDKNIMLGRLKLVSRNFKEVKIVGRQLVTEQKGDTVEYHADAFKTNPDASAEDLVSKMPGITNNGGTLQAHGEDVKKVLVDGKPYFGDDPSAALRNLPADIVDKVQVFDKSSDQSQFTGFDDGNSQKTINITTKKDKQNGQFGKFIGGYGTDNRYSGTAIVNSFNGNQRISVMGLSNNVNQQNFATQDLLGVTGSSGGSGRGGHGGGRPSGNWMPNNPALSNFLVGAQGGNNITNSAGLNYSDSIGKKLSMSGSYFFNNTNNISQSILARTYFSSQNVNPLYDETDYNTSKNFNHRTNLRLEYGMDSMNTFIFTPKFSYQTNTSTSNVIGINRLQGADTTSRTENNYYNNSFGYDINASLLWQHKFAKKGRTLSWNIGLDISPKNASDTLHSNVKYYSPNDSEININQQSASPSKSYGYSSNINYTEPIGKSGQLMLSYSPSYTQSSLDKKLYVQNGINTDYDVLDTSLSNSYNYTTLINNAGISYRIRIKNINLGVGASAQNTLLQGNQVFPVTADVSHPFNTLLPNAMFSEKFENKSNLRIMYRTSTNVPSIQQLQSVINNTNPLILTTGNPDLDQSYTHSLMMHYGKTNSQKAHSFFVFANVSTTSSYIGNSTIIAFRDSILPGGYRLARGSQFSSPVNLDNYWTAGAFATFGLPLDFIKSNLNLNAGISYNTTPGLINNKLNYANTLAMSPSVVISSNISPELDYTLSYYSSYNIVNNTLNTSSNNNYFTHTAAFKANWIFWKGFTLSADVSHNLYTGLSSRYNQSLFLLNAGIAKKLFKDNSGEIKLYAFDILNQNTSITRTVTDTEVDDLRTQVLQRYFMLQFTYNLKHFVAKS